MRVRTMPGHRQLTPTDDPESRSSANIVSAIAIAACFVVLYGAAPGNDVSPAIDAVMTTWPSPCSLRCGRNDEMPWMIPQMFTPKAHCQSAADRVSIGPLPPATPALRQTTLTWPNSRDALARRAPRMSALERHVRAHADRVRAAGSELLDRSVERSLLDVRQHHVHAGLREAFRERRDPSRSRHP